MKKSSLILINILLTACVIILDIIYDLVGGLGLKSVTSLAFVILGAINLFCCIKMNPPKIKFAVIMMTGIIFAMLGDITLAISFILGAATFAVGHIFYLISFCVLLKPNQKDLTWGILIFIFSVLVITLVPAFSFGSILMEIVCIVYALILSLMTGKGISNLIREKTPLNITLAIGSFLFYFSDAMLIFHVFTNISPIFDRLCLYTYYPAQCVLSISIYFAAISKPSKINT